MNHITSEYLIGRTPLVSLSRFCPEGRILGKLELCNLTGSVKDRAALSMLRAAGLRPGDCIIEATSGNMGISLACLAALQGLRCIIVMPDSMSRERQALIRAYSAEVVLTPGALGMAGARETAEVLARELPGILLSQFDNPANPEAHYRTTGPEIWADTEGRVDILVAGVGTGGTVSGTGRFLREQNPRIQIVAVEPAGSPLLSAGHTGPHGIQGLGPNFLPGVLDRPLIDRVIPVSDNDAATAARLLARTEGILSGFSSGAALHAARLLAREPENEGKTLVAILPDSGQRYLSTALYPL